MRTRWCLPKSSSWGCQSKCSLWREICPQNRLGPGARLPKSRPSLWKWVPAVCCALSTLAGEPWRGCLASDERHVLDKSEVVRDGKCDGDTAKEAQWAPTLLPSEGEAGTTL